jgi:hypothetical protein
VFSPFYFLEFDMSVNDPVRVKQGLVDLILAADKEAEAAIKAGEGQELVKKEAAETLRLLRNAAPVNLADANELREETKRLQAAHDQAVTRIEVARVANLYRIGIRQRWPELFDEPEGRPVNQPVPPIVQNELSRLDLPQWSANPELHLAPARVFSSVKGK